MVNGDFPFLYNSSIFFKNAPNRQRYMFVFIDISTYLIVSGTQTGPIVKFKSV